MVEFANRDNVWVYKNIDCITRVTYTYKMHVTDCLVPLESLRKYPLFLLPNAMVRIRVWAVNRATGMRAPADGWDCKPKDGQGTVIFSDQSAIYTGEVDE